MHSKQKGTLAETKVTSDLYQKGFYVAKPIDDLTPFDLICIDKFYNLYKVQVKYCKLNDGKIVLNLRRCMSNKNLSYNKIYQLNEVDVFALYCHDTDECFYVKSDVLDKCKATFNLRITKPLNNNRNNIHFKKDYTDFPVNTNV
jgi:hypothetical protein